MSLARQRQIADRDQIASVVVRAEHAECIDLPLIILALTAAMVLRRGNRKPYRAGRDAPGLALDSTEDSIGLGYQVVAKIVSKGHQDPVAFFQKRRHDHRLGDIANDFRVEASDAGIHFRG